MITVYARIPRRLFTALVRSRWLHVGGDYTQFYYSTLDAAPSVKSIRGTVAYTVVVLAVPSQTTWFHFVTWVECLPLVQRSLEPTFSPASDWKVSLFDQKTWFEIIFGRFGDNSSTTTHLPKPKIQLISIKHCYGHQDKRIFLHVLSVSVSVYFHNKIHDTIIE